ncbi:DinB family protein [Mucilaginibacter phyllosphaerae]
MENKFLNLSFSSWNLQVSRLKNIIETLSDEQLAQPISPGRNSGWYIVGHLIAVNDAMSEILGTGKRAYPELHSPFVQNSEQPAFIQSFTGLLRNYFLLVHVRLQEEFTTLTEDAWLARHAAMTDEDFLKNPLRNKYSVLLNRTNHLSYHLGQLRLLY